MVGITPAGALVRGVAAGAAASTAMGLFFKATSGYAASPPRTFAWSRAAKERTAPTAKLARRVARGLMDRRGLSRSAEQKAAMAIHYAFGAGWSALWGIARESFPALRSPVAGAGFGALVWAISDEVLLPLFRLAPKPPKTPARTHAYFLAAHLVFGLAAWAAYESSRRTT